MTQWSVLGRVSDGVRGFHLRGHEILADKSAVDEAGVLAALGTDVVSLRLGAEVSDTVPTSVIPGTQHSGFGHLEQTSPPDVISAWVRLWIAGYLHRNPDWDGVICATHGSATHWIHISAKEVVSTQSTLTPRLIMHLGGHSEASQEAMEATLSRPERLAAHLRAAELTSNARAVTGHLIGAELAATRAYWLGQEVIVLSDTPDAYVSALKAQAVVVSAHAPEEIIPAGLAALADSYGFVL